MSGSLLSYIAILVGFATSTIHFNLALLLIFYGTAARWEESEPGSETTPVSEHQVTSISHGLINFDVTVDTPALSKCISMLPDFLGFTGCQPDMFFSWPIRRLNEQERKDTVSQLENGKAT